MNPLLKVVGLKKYFPVYEGVFRRCTGYVYAVDGVDFEVYPGEAVGIVGESGCGKSTAGRALVRLIEPTSGQIWYKEINLLSLSYQKLLEVRKEIQLVFQDPFSSLNPRKTVFDAVGEAVFYHKIVKTPQGQKEKVKELLQLVGLSPKVMDRYPHEFSGGQQQRISIARALSLNPKLLICDEAVSALDVSVQAQIINLLLELKEKFHLSFIFISHDLSVVRHFCDRVVVMYLGKVMESAPVESLFSSPQHPYTQALLASMLRSHPRDKRESQILKGEVPSALHPPSGCPFRTRCPFAQPICAKPPPKQEADTPFGKRISHCILPIR